MSVMEVLTLLNLITNIIKLTFDLSKNKKEIAAQHHIRQLFHS